MAHSTEWSCVLNLRGEKFMFKNESKNRKKDVRSLKRTPFIIALTLLLCVSSVPLQAYGAVTPPPEQ